jgi:hypothetical protein
MGHDQLFLFIDLHHRLTTQPVEQIVGVRRLKQRFQPIFGFIAANARKDRQQVQVMIAQHDANAIAKLFHETQHFQRTGPRATRSPVSHSVSTSGLNSPALIMRSVHRSNRERRQ